MRWLGVAITLLLTLMAVPLVGVPTVAASGQAHAAVYYCPGSVDGSSISLSDYQSACATIATGVNFDISVGGTDVGTVQSSNSGELLVQNAPEGQLYIQPQPPTGYYSETFCSFYSAGSSPSSYIYYGDSGAAGQVDSYNYVDCYIYLVANGSVSYETVYVNKHWCPASYDATSGTIYDLAQYCQDPYTGSVNFTVADSAGAQSTQSITGANTATWSNVAVGDVTVTESYPDGYSRSRVFCKQSDDQNNETSEDEVQVASNGSIDVSFQSGYTTLFCDWFNLAGYPTEIYINKHWCPEGYQVKHDPYDLAANCKDTSYSNSVTFDLTGKSYGSAGGQGTGDVQANAVDFTNLPADTWTVSEQVPDGYGSPIVYCKEIKLADNSEGDYNEVGVADDASITQEVDQGYQLYCDWYNIYSTPYVTVTIHKYVCSQYYDSSSTYQYLQSECPDYSKNVSFTATWSGGSPATQQTDGSGDPLTWGNIPSGDVSVQESIPQGYGSPLIYCSISDSGGNPSDYNPYSADDNGSVGWTLTDYQTIDCYWFNIPYTNTSTATYTPTYASTYAPTYTPTKASGPATLTIVKSLCPEGYDVLDWKADPENDCDQTVDGVPFALSNQAGQTKTATTGDAGDGTLTFTNIKAGDYLLTENWPASEDIQIDYAFVLSCTSNVRTFDTYPFAPFAMMSKQLATRITLYAGEKLTCEWYNVPLKKTSGSGDATITIEKYNCAGSSINSASCPPASAGVGFTLDPQSGDPISVKTGNDGTVTLTLNAGSYDLSEDSGNWCFADSSAFAQDGSVTVKSGDKIDIKIYNCGQ